VYKINTNLVRRYARKYAEMNMASEVRIDRPGKPTLDTTTGDATATVLSTVYAGKARVTTVGGPQQYSLGEEPQYFSSGSVSIPLFDEEGQPTMPQVNDVVIVTAHHDVLMVNRAFRVMDVQASGQLEAVRNMSVTGVQRWEGWEASPAIPSEWYV